MKDISNVLQNLVFCPQKTVHSGRGGKNINTSPAAFGVPARLNDISSKLLF